VNLAGVDLNLLVTLDALLAERSVTRAATRIGLSQPGMSNALARLRKLFDDPLLVREGLNLVPTPRALALAAPVREALALIQGAMDDRSTFDPATGHCNVTVSCSDYSILMLIGPLVRRLAAEAPGVTIQAVPRDSEPARLLRDGEVDLVIEPSEIMPGVALPASRLFEDRWLCCVSAGNSRVGETIDIDTFLGLGHVVYSMGRGKPISLVDQYLTRSGLPRRIEFTLESFLLTPALLQGTDLITLVLARAGGHLKRTADVRFLEPPLALPPITETLFWHPRHTADPAHAWIRARIGEIAADLDRSPEAGPDMGAGYAAAGSVAAPTGGPIAHVNDDHSRHPIAE
jgi:LysR family transcriptional regulator, nod-box dependent transcriptional activator